MFCKGGNSELLRLTKVAYLISVTSSEANGLVRLCDLNLYLPLELEGAVRVQFGAGDVNINPDGVWGHSGSGTVVAGDFSTHFVVVIDSEGRPNFADGLAFFLAPDGSKITAGGAIGLPIDPITIVPTSPFAALEFDTFQNGWDPVNVGRAHHFGLCIALSKRKNGSNCMWCIGMHVKSRNVMLEWNLNAKLGDFGFARLVDHEKES
ncbi:hypothetical protein RHMOL_Rhmol11G0217100 [Rhododendron molle]|uniref:Uncharacterized protein n=1 Tax=Rhododendron molle TaxID=49168 RepID=A0ACC0LVR5_RHOML|nr:hypothetical protein RHMOL_Rhmol11G0217100 [Rhododendron molle]